MLVTKLRGIRRKLGSTPCKFEIQASLLLSEPFKHLPEHLDHLMVLTDIVVFRNCLQIGNFDVFATTCSDFNFFPSKESQDGKLDNVRDTAFHPFHLL